MNLLTIINSAAGEPTWMFNWGDALGFEHYYAHLLAKIILIIYGISLTLILFYSILQLSLAIKYKLNQSVEKKPLPKFDPEKAPLVTVQLPMYNEYYVAERVIERVAQLDYPKDKFEIQVLDDSTDETVDVIAKKVEEVRAKYGVDIKHIHRVNRIGYKAGALDDALPQAKGEFIAIFDVDFLPDTDFLQKTIPQFED